VGLKHHPNPLPDLETLLHKLIHSVEKLPSCHYRSSVLAVSQDRLSKLKLGSREEIEKAVGGGLLEELIVQTKEEIQLVKKMQEWKANEQ
jgi:NADH dehydrogenase (ubiquinone) 1 alpha subcomplex subunit 5